MSILFICIYAAKLKRLEILNRTFTLVIHDTEFLNNCDETDATMSELTVHLC